MKLITLKQPDSSSLPAGEFKGYHDFRDHDGMFKEDAADTAILLAGARRRERTAVLLAQKGCSATAKAVYNVAGTSAGVIIVELAAGAFEKGVVVQELQAAEDGLRTLGKQGGDVVRPKKTVLVNETNYLTITFGDRKCCSTKGAFETGEAGLSHSTSVAAIEK